MVFVETLSYWFHEPSLGEEIATSPHRESSSDETLRFLRIFSMMAVMIFNGFFMWRKPEMREDLVNMGSHKNTWR